GSPDDGVTAHVPLALLDGLDPGQFEWGIPGQRLELVTALIRSLPKAVRRNFVPAPDYAHAFLAEAGPDDGPLGDSMARVLGRMTGEPVPAGAWDLNAVPAHLRVTFSVEDETGRRLAAGKDLDALRVRLARRMRQAVADAARDYERGGLTGWSFGRLPRAVNVQWAGHSVQAYPALADEGDAVAIRVFTSRDDAERAMWAGTRRLLLLTLTSPKRQLQRSLPNETKLALARHSDRRTDDLLGDCISGAVDIEMAGAGGPAWDEEGFERLRATIGPRLAGTALYVATVMGGISAAAAGVGSRLDAAAPSPSIDDMRGQLARLVTPDMVTSLGNRRLADVLRYLDAMSRRLDKLGAGGGTRDRELMGRARQLEEEYEHVLAVLSPGRRHSPAVEETRWLLEEFRVSLFAQSLGTAQPVSEQRIRRRLDQLAADGPPD
ncbi:MAG: DUF3418 domain-containing protein, partial [Acidimicrobiia bacterium]